MSRATCKLTCCGQMIAAADIKRKLARTLLLSIAYFFEAINRSIGMKQLAVLT